MLLQYHILAHHLQRFLKYVEFLETFLEFCHHKLLGFIDQYALSMPLIFFSLQNAKFVYNFESLSLNTRRGSWSVHFTVLAPLSNVSLGKGSTSPTRQRVVLYTRKWPLWIKNNSVKCTLSKRIVVKTQLEY